MGSHRVVSIFALQCTEVRFASFFSSEFTTMAVMNPTERKLAKRTSLHWDEIISDGASMYFHKHLRFHIVLKNHTST